VIYDITKSKIKICLNCSHRLGVGRRYYCSEQCDREHSQWNPHMREQPHNILAALVDTNGIRWLPDSISIHSLAENRNVPLIEIINYRGLDCLVRLTMTGWYWAKELGLYDEKEAV
jgi:hypothetical protein